MFDEFTKKRFRESDRQIWQGSGQTYIWAPERIATNQFLDRWMRRGKKLESVKDTLPYDLIQEL
jgi:hypothetical protein